MRSLAIGWPHPRIYVFDGDFFDDIRAKKYSKISMQISEIEDLLSYGLLIIPVHTGRYRVEGVGHVGIEVLDLKKRSVSYYDSDLFRTNPKEVEHYHQIMR
jgi:hypothetical protein